MNDDELRSLLTEISDACFEYSPGFRNTPAMTQLRPALQRLRREIENRDELGTYQQEKLEELESAVVAAFDREHGGPKHLDRRARVLAAAMKMKSSVLMILDRDPDL